MFEQETVLQQFSIESNEIPYTHLIVLNLCVILRNTVYVQCTEDFVKPRYGTFPAVPHQICHFRPFVGRHNE